VHLVVLRKAVQAEQGLHRAFAEARLADDEAAAVILDRRREISEAEAEPRLISTPIGPSQAMPGLVSLSTSTLLSPLRCMTTGPLSMNRPVSSTASVSEPPPLLRRSISTLSTLSFFSSTSRR
jgi:hypothetical protein